MRQLPNPIEDPIREARVVRVIKTTALVGLGEPGSPYREISQYWDMETGELIGQIPNVNTEGES